MKPTRHEIWQAVMQMALVIPFFPQSEPAQEIIIASLCDFVGNKTGLDWLTTTAIRAMKKWAGVAELRGIYCTRYEPIDGLPHTASEIPGFTPEEACGAAEMAYITRCDAENEKKLLAWKKEAALQITDGQPEEPATLHLEEVKTTLRPSVEDLRAARQFDELLNPPMTAYDEAGAMSEKRKVPLCVPTAADRKRLESEAWFQDYLRLRRPKEVDENRLQKSE